MNIQDHWNNIYAQKAATQVSWFREHLEPSIELIESANLAKDASIIDIGGGASTLIDDLLDLGYENITVLDISQSAHDKTKARLGDRAESVN